MRRKGFEHFLLASSVLLMGVVLLSSCSKPAGQKKIKDVTIGTFSKALSYGPLYVAKHFDWLKEEPAFSGVNVIFNEYNDRPAISASLSSKELDLLFSAEVPAIMCSAQGDHIQIVKLSSTAIQKVLVRSELDSRMPADLRGRKVAVLQGTSSHYCLLKILRSGGLTEKDVILVYMTPPEARVAFEGKKIDAWAVWAPFGEQQEVKGTGREIEGEGGSVHSVVSVPAWFMKDHEEIVRATIACIERGKQWIVKNPDEAKKIVSEALQLDIAVVNKAWPKFHWDGQLTESVITDMQDKAVFLAELDKTRLSKKVDVRKELLDKRYLPGAE